MVSLLFVDVVSATKDFFLLIYITMCSHADTAATNIQVLKLWKFNFLFSRTFNLAGVTQVFASTHVQYLLLITDVHFVLFVLFLKSSKRV